MKTQLLIFVDIIISDSKSQSGAFCYISQVLTPLKTLGYTKSICTLAGFHIVARKHKFGKAPKMRLIHMISQLFPELI